MRPPRPSANTCRALSCCLACDERRARVQEKEALSTQRCTDGSLPRPKKFARLLLVPPPTHTTRGACAPRARPVRWRCRAVSETPQSGPFPRCRRSPCGKCELMQPCGPVPLCHSPAPCAEDGSGVMAKATLRRCLYMLMRS